LLGIEELASDLQVSKTPVREALTRLSVEGFIELTPNKRPVVKGLTREEVCEIYDMREHFEPYLAKMAIVQVQRDQPLRETLANLINQMEDLLRKLDLDGNSRDLLTAYIDTGHRFQEILAKAAGKGPIRRIADVINNYIFHLRVFANPALKKKMERMRSVIVEHLEILKAIQESDADAAFGTIVRHLEAGRIRTLEAFDEESPAIVAGTNPSEVCG